MISSWTFLDEVSRSQYRHPSGPAGLGSASLRAGSIPLIVLNFSHLEGVSVSAEWLKDSVCIR